MSIYQIDPAQDARWAEFVEGHPRAHVFATPQWLEALRRTYGCEPFVLTTSPPGADLANGLPVCRVKSWLTGRRLISLPFTDHCEPLVNTPAELSEMLSYLAQEVRTGKWKYAEVRPVLSAPGAGEAAAGFQAAQEYFAHQLSLTPGSEEIFGRFHKSCVQRKIRRAEREGLVYEAGNTEALLARFYHLLTMTRRRHGLPPQPREWFQNLIACLGDKVTVHVALKEGRPVASILTLIFKKTIVYKYGGSDARYHNLGGMPFLFWRAIQGARKAGMEEFDLGRSDADQDGLVAFKEHLGATRAQLTYYRCGDAGPGWAASGWKLRAAKRVFARLPGPLLNVAGRLLYKHIP